MQRKRNYADGVLSDVVALKVSFSIYRDLTNEYGMGAAC